LLADCNCQAEVLPDRLAELAVHISDALGSQANPVPVAQVGSVDYRHLARVPGDLVWQLGQRLASMGASERLGEVVAEIGRIRQEVGGPALVAPVAQIIATQAVLNVVYQKRWQLVPDEMKACLRGDYGSPPQPVAQELQQYSAGREPAGAAAREPSPFEAARQALGELAVLPGDDLLHILAPQAAGQFLQKRRAAGELEGMFGPSQRDEGSSDTADQWEDLGPERVRELMSLLESSTVDELSVENQGTRVTLRKAAPVFAAAVPGGVVVQPGDNAVAQVAAPSEVETHYKATASMVGTFYRSAAPGVAPYVEVGAHVDKGDPLCVLEAMKLMNELLSEVSGEILAVLVEDGAAVEYGQPLFLIELDQE
jgi:oxaloacetate decarboxylase alpha subunit